MFLGHRFVIDTPEVTVSFFFAKIASSFESFYIYLQFDFYELQGTKVIHKIWSQKVFRILLTLLNWLIYPVLTPQIIFSAAWAAFFWSDPFAFFNLALITDKKHWSFMESLVTFQKSSIKFLPFSCRSAFFCWDWIFWWPRAIAANLGLNQQWHTMNHQDSR